MRGKKLSSWVMLIAFVIVCLISVPAFSGEHPWDSDNKNGTDGNGGSGDNPDTSTPVVLKASVSHGGDVVCASHSPLSLLFRVSYSTAEKLYAKMYDAGAKSARQSKSVGR